MADPQFEQMTASSLPARRRPPPTWRELHLGGDAVAERLQIDRWATMPPHEKMAKWASLNAMALRLARSGIRMRHPDASEAEARWRLAELLHGREIAEAILGSLDAVDR